MSNGEKTISFEVICPCCQATLQVDPELHAVLTCQEAEKPRELKDIESGLEKLKEDKARREETFQKSVEAEKTGSALRSKKFDELFKKAKETPEETPRIRDIDLD